jgi:hypothetical protein
MAATARSVIPIMSAMSRSRAVGLAAMHWSVCAWFVTNRQSWSLFLTLDFMNAVTIVWFLPGVHLLLRRGGVLELMGIVKGPTSACTWGGIQPFRLHEKARLHLTVH